MTRRQIVAALRAVGEGFTSWEPEEVRQRLIQIELGVEALPDPVAIGAIPPHDCSISLKAAVKAGARITIEPANPEG